MSFRKSISSEAFAKTDDEKDIFSTVIHSFVRHYVYKIPEKKELNLQISCRMQIHCCHEIYKLAIYAILYLFCYYIYPHFSQNFQFDIKMY